MAVCLDHLHEQTLVIRSQLGDETAFTQLWERYGPRLLMFAQRMMQASPGDVADVTQDNKFADLWLNTTALSGGANVLVSPTLPLRL